MIPHAQSAPLALLVSTSLVLVTGTERFPLIAPKYRAFLRQHRQRQPDFAKASDFAEASISAKATTERSSDEPEDKPARLLPHQDRLDPSTLRPFDKLRAGKLRAGRLRAGKLTGARSEGYEWLVRSRDTGQTTRRSTGPTIRRSGIGHRRSYSCVWVHCDYHSFIGAQRRSAVVGNSEHYVDSPW